MSVDRSAVRWLCGVTLLSAAVLGAAGCSESPHPHTLVFDIGGQGELASLTYVIDGKRTTQSSVRLPWRNTVHLPAKDGGHRWRLTTRQSSGSSHVVVYVDGHPITNGACAGDGCGSDDSGSIKD